MPDPLAGETVHIGGQTRTLLFTFAALRVCQRAFKGRPVREMIQQLDVDVVAEFAAAGFLHENRKVTPDKIVAWLEAEPSKYIELQGKVAMAIAHAFRRMMPKEEADEMGETLRAVEEEMASTTARAGETTGGQTSRASSG